MAADLPPVFDGPGEGRYIVYPNVGVMRDDAQIGIWIYDMTGEVAPRRIFERNGIAHWTNHGQTVVIGVPIGQAWKTFETWQVNADGSAESSCRSLRATWSLIARTMADGLRRAPSAADRTIAVGST